MRPVLDERLRRLWAAAEALALGTGGIAVLSEVTGLSRTTIRAGIEELRGSEEELARLAKEGRVRRPGGGRKSVVELDATLEADLEALLESSKEGGVLDWTCKSIRGLAAELALKGHQVSYRTVGNLLHRLGFCFSPVDGFKKFILSSRHEQFHRLSSRAALFLANSEPVVVLAFSAEPWRQTVVPDRRIAGLAAAVLRYWGQESAPWSGHTRRMLLLLDTAGLSSGDRGIWAPLLQPFADETGVEIIVSHFPPGARRWHRSTQEVTCSYSRTVGGADRVLTITLEQIPPLGGGAHERSAFSQDIWDSYDGIWNYRIDGRS